MFQSIRTGAIAALLALVSLPTAAVAQQTAPTPEQPATHAERFEASLARMSGEFWTKRMNAYKVEIDRMLSASDLIALNELRIRASIVMDRLKELEQKRKERERDAVPAPSYSASDTATASAIDARVAFDSPATVDTMTAEAEVAMRNAIDTTGGEEEYSEGESSVEGEYSYEDYLQENAEQVKGQIALLDRLVAGDEKALEEQLAQRNEDRSRRYFEYDEEMQEQMALVAEYSRISDVCIWIARNYQPSMEQLVAGYFSDIDAFLEATRVHSREFISESGRAALEEKELVSTMLETLQGLRSVRAMIDSDMPGSAVMREMIEAQLMLHNGQDLAAISMIGSDPAASAAAEPLPASSTLGQNSPNPASSRTTIPYTLVEGANKVTIQLLDARGTLVATYEQGAREPGEHSLSIDVSALAPGTYLYQLTVTTAQGERVSSKGMQVVR
jgi:hypothetical protein